MLPTVHMDSQLLHGSTIEILWFVKLQWSTRVCINDVKYMYNEFVNITSLHTNDYGWSAIFPQQQFGQPCSTAYLMISDCHLSLGGKQRGYRGELQVTLQEIVCSCSSVAL